MIRNEGERLWRREDRDRQDEGVADEARRLTRVHQDTAVNPPEQVVALLERRHELRRTTLNCLD